MRQATRNALVSRLSDYGSVVEIGIGNRVEVAQELASAGVRVTATDIHRRTVPPDVEFVVDDVTAPELTVYTDAEALYALNLPPELHRPTRKLARAVDADFLFTTLGGDPPVVPVRPETIPGETLYVAVPVGEKLHSGRSNLEPTSPDDSNRNVCAADDSLGDASEQDA